MKDDLGKDVEFVKVVLLGAPETGKTAVFSVFTNVSFPEEYKKTSSVDLDYATANAVQFQLADIGAELAIEEVEKNLVDTNILLLFVDSKNPDTLYFEKYKDMITQRQQAHPEMKCYLIHSKWDGDNKPDANLLKERKSEIEAFGISLDGNFQCSANSAKLNLGVKRLFEKLTGDVLPEEDFVFHDGRDSAELVKSSFISKFSSVLFPCFCPKNKGGDNEKTPLVGDSESTGSSPD